MVAKSFDTQEQPNEFSGTNAGAPDTKIQLPAQYLNRVRDYDKQPLL